MPRAFPQPYRPPAQKHTLASDLNLPDYDAGADVAAHLRTTLVPFISPLHAAKKGRARTRKPASVSAAPVAVVTQRRPAANFSMPT